MRTCVYFHTPPRSEPLAQTRPGKLPLCPFGCVTRLKHYADYQGAENTNIYKFRWLSKAFFGIFIFDESRTCSVYDSFLGTRKVK